jgi:hypothetical protein
VKSLWYASYFHDEQVEIEVGVLGDSVLASYVKADVL